MPEKTSITFADEVSLKAHGLKPETLTGHRLKNEAFYASASEAQIQAGIAQLLDLLHIPFSITDASRSFNAKGQVRSSKVRKSWPDISGCLPSSGRALYIEVKTLTGKFKPGQLEMLERLRDAGACVIVARDLETVASNLRDAGVEHQIITQLLKGEGNAKNQQTGA